MDRQPCGIDAQPFFVGEKLPGPVDGVALEIVAETEVSQHLEERMVIGGPADVLDVAGSQTFLAGGRPRVVQLDLAQEVVLELVHTRRREQHAGIPSGDQHVASDARVALGFEEGQVLFAKFVRLHDV